MSDKLVNTVYEVINPENIYGLVTYTIEPVTNIITTFFSYAMDIESHLTAIHLEWWWLYGLFASVSQQINFAIVILLISCCAVVCSFCFAESTRRYTVVNQYYPMV